MLVLFFHFSLFRVINAGFIGVDIFFVISGFLITTILKGRLDENRFSFGAFYVARIRRLAPALLIVLFMTLLAGSIWLFPTDFSELSKQALVAQLYIANIYYWRSINYFGLTAQDTYLLHTWSLAVEEQFYLFYPALLLLLHRYFLNYFWKVIAGLFLLSFFLNIAFMGPKPEAAFYLFPTRAWELLMGALVSLLVQIGKRTKSADEIISLGGLILVAVGACCYRKDFHFPGFYALLPTIGAASLLLSGQTHPTVIAGLLSLKPVRYVGKISYSLYLVHWPINIFASILIDNYSLGWRFAMLALSICLAAVIYHTIENPIHRKEYVQSKFGLLSLYAAGITASIGAFAVAEVTHGFPQRFPPNVLRLASYVNDHTAPLTECESQDQGVLASSADCRIGVANQSPEWFVYGDSHAWAAHAVFDTWLRINGTSGLFAFMPGCPPVIGVHLVEHNDGCFAFNEAARRLLEGRPDLTNIALVADWREASEGLLSSSSESPLTPAQSVNLFTDQLSRTLKQFHDLGRHVYIWEPVPGARKSVPQALARAALDHRSADIEIDEREYFSQTQFFFDAITNDKEWITRSFSPSGVLCKTGKCIVEDGGRPLYIDNNHMTKSTADFWIRVLQDHAVDNSSYEDLRTGP
jgi:peptidoglycan/LPS O-acetylase OafA/YrhL